MARVIQDSDDDLEDDLEVDVPQIAKKDASPKQSTGDTSSTEALRRQIEAAHRAHLQTQFPLSDGQTSGTIDENHHKRKVPVDFESNSTSGERSSLRRAPVTYSKRSRGVPSSSPLGQQEAQNVLHKAPQSTGTTCGTDWVLDGTMREAYAQHNPNTLFPEPSSTVPNASFTQQRVLEGVLAPALLGSDLDTDRSVFQPDASIPWSEYLKSPTNTGEQPRSSAQDPQISQLPSATIPEPLPPDKFDPRDSQRNPQEAGILIETPSHDVCLEVIDTQDITMFTEDVDQAEKTLASTVKSVPQEEVPSSLRQKKRRSPAPTSDDDLADLGLPKEQYKPRPSRSRSLKTDTQESINYSIRPEKNTKAIRRRKSSPASASLAGSLSTPDRVQQICDMGFTPSTSERALKQNNGDVTQSVDWLITNKIADDELISHTPQMSKNACHQSRTNTDNEQSQNNDFHENNIDAEQTIERDNSATSAVTYHNAESGKPETNAPVIDVRSPTKVQVVIPAKSPDALIDTPATFEMSCKKYKREKTTLNLPEPKTTANAANGAKVEKKRGRGRPKKAANTTLSTENVQDKEDEVSLKQVCGSPLLPSDRRAQVNTIQHDETLPSPIATTEIASHGSETPHRQAITSTLTTSSSTPEPIVLPDRPEVEPITPERVKKPAHRQHASSDKAKVPYRVGLSKRARIAPLLRVMRK